MAVDRAVAKTDGQKNEPEGEASRRGGELAESRLRKHEAPRAVYYSQS